jgi:hypothetical protein
VTVFAEVQHKSNDFIACICLHGYDETFMKLSPRQLADAIGVSESSLKRWADAGKLAVSRTEGGHRRISMTEAVRFIRDTGATVVRPDLLGLGAPARARGGTARGAKSAELTTDAATVRAMLVARFLGGESFAALADELVLPAICRIEDLYPRDTKSELAARASSDAWTHAVAAVRGLCVIAPDAPLALGGAREAGLGAMLRSAVVATVLAAEGLRVMDLGAHVGAGVLRAAVAAHQPAMAWSVLGDGDGEGKGGMVVVEGYRIRTMGELAAYARGLGRCQL